MQKKSTLKQGTPIETKFILIALQYGGQAPGRC
jgi:hypothetical protein